MRLTISMSVEVDNNLSELGSDRVKEIVKDAVTSKLLELRTLSPKVGKVEYEKDPEPMRFVWDGSGPYG